MNRRVKIYSFLIVIIVVCLVYVQLDPQDKSSLHGKKGGRREEKSSFELEKVEKFYKGDYKTKQEKSYSVYETTLIDNGFKRWEHGGENEFIYRLKPKQKKLKVVDALKLSGFKRKDFFPVVVYNSMALQAHLLAHNRNQQCYISFQVSGDKKEYYYDDAEKVLGLSELCLDKELTSFKIKTRCTDTTPLMFQRYQEW